jgi:hypothetical protein
MCIFLNFLKINADTVRMRVLWRDHRLIEGIKASACRFKAKCKVVLCHALPFKQYGELFRIVTDSRTNAKAAIYISCLALLYRVIIHGVLHLCGINDKGEGEREIMEACENKALAMRER